ncbi:TPA: hypothetical protein DIC20_02465 [Candidatus Dependentiae bacterium]|nr:MAG: hypothetical protein US03_C0003G0050 [candidate division TM6 bacterium GW2011_GWF2_36_131]KKQ03369.1 MAG: hypothetical protein US13_C0003G0050 [candidate division TM6 bacterium GW2011_GWE2_36_25]KKQ18621.1 MAG: hypothetical protein US32_C0024G0005 [candidate division TM6 bacterium GW2011_GWA2_36_9]HBR70853.1 hypothetical protein [Candidatus Dependentiae bacterium]HCU00544.1 hypothetical protein [Candidatus Dependentiae bacterium]
MKKIHLGYDLALETCSWAWHYKRLFWYPLIIAFLKYLFESGILTNFFGMMSRYSLLIVKELGISITIVFIFAALTNRFYVLFVNKKMSFFESFHFDEGILPKLVVLTFIFAIADFIKKYFVIGSGINLNYEQATGLQVQIVYAELLIWILSLILFSVWSLMIFYVVPILIKKNESLWVTIKEAFLFVCNNLLVTITAQLVYIIFWLSSLLALGTLVFFVMWIIALICSIPLSFAWFVPFVLIMFVPAVLFSLYIGMIELILPAMLYLKLSKKR